MSIRRTAVVVSCIRAAIWPGRAGRDKAVHRLHGFIQRGDCGLHIGGQTGQGWILQQAVGLPCQRRRLIQQRIDWQFGKAIDQALGPGNQRRQRLGRVGDIVQRAGNRGAAAGLIDVFQHAFDAFGGCHQFGRQRRDLGRQRLCSVGPDEPPRVGHEPDGGRHQLFDGQGVHPGQKAVRC